MKRYTVTGTAARFAPDTVLALSQAQYRDRADDLEKIKGAKDLYRVLRTVEFKKGEELGIKGAVDKVTREVVTSPGDEKRETDNTEGDLFSHDSGGSASGEDDDDVDLETLSDQELISMATECGIEEVGNLDRDALILAIMEKCEAAE